MRLSGRELMVGRSSPFIFGIGVKKLCAFLDVGLVVGSYVHFW
jgi:hypothetical protein